MQRQHDLLVSEICEEIPRESAQVLTCFPMSRICGGIGLQVIRL
jgi:hypothetical protein